MKPLPIGESNFKDLIEKESFYVDKTIAIEELLSKGNKVVLFPRPRRFGKSLFMSMLNNFFDIDLKEANKDLFKDLKISKSPFYKELNTYPTIYINFKDLKSDNYESAFYMFKSLIMELYISKEYIEDILNEDEKEIFKRLKGNKGNLDEYKKSIKYLSIWLERYHNKQVIILIDEYDAAINEGYILGYYDEIINLLSPVLSSALKDNTSLKMGVLTGVLRVGGESLFSSFNNLAVYDVMSKNYNEYFGFTKEETEILLKHYNLEKTKEVDDYYDGYNFSGVHIYNPWSILNYADEQKLEPYWMSTGSNKLIKNLLSNLSDLSDIETLLEGKSIIFDYDKSITYESFTTPNNLNNLLNLLLVSGYVTLDKTELEDGENINYFKIPNYEVRNDMLKIVQNVIFNEESNITSRFLEFRRSLVSNNIEKVESIMNEALMTMSYYDETESFYHGFAFGFYSSFLSNRTYEIDSNIESGEGRPDILIEKKDRSLGIILEFKIAKDEIEFENEKQNIKANNQLEEKEYDTRLKAHNIKEIRKYTITFYKKKCIVR